MYFYQIEGLKITTKIQQEIEIKCTMVDFSYKLVTNFTFGMVQLFETRLVIRVPP